MIVDILKFLGLLTGMALINCYVPYGILVSYAIVFYALWKLVNRR